MSDPAIEDLQQENISLESLIPILNTTRETTSVLISKNKSHNDQKAMAHNPPTDQQSLMAFWEHNFYFNLTVILAFPLGIMSEKLHWGESPTFIINMISVICLAKSLDLATDQLAQQLGSTIGGLLNVTFGNFVELVIGVFGLIEGLLIVVQASLLGSVLSNLLLVLGCCIFLGGLKNKTQKFNASAANVNASLLLISAFGMIIPSAFLDEAKLAGVPDASNRALHFSRATSFLLLIAYMSFIVFQLVTHAHLFQSVEDDNDEDKEIPVVNIRCGIGALLAISVLIAVSAENLVGSIEGISKSWNISETAIGLIVIPVVGNAPEHMAAIFAAMRNKMDLSIGIALGSSLQIAIFCTPLLVIIGWMIGQPFTLSFPIYDAVVVFISILVVNHIISDGESNWLEGAMMLICYLILAIGYFLIA